jgi:hypothetical protein
VPLIVVAIDGSTDPAATIPLPAATVPDDVIFLVVSNLSANISDPRFTLVAGTGGSMYVSTSTGDNSPITGVTQFPDGFGDSGYVLAVLRGITAMSTPTVLSVTAPDVFSGVAIPVAVPDGSYNAAVGLYSLHGRGSPGSTNLADGVWTETVQQTTPFFANAVALWNLEDFSAIPPPIVSSNSAVTDTRAYAIFGLTTIPPVVRQYPRDDSYGQVGGPRLFPPPRGRRVVGGQS